MGVGLEVDGTPTGVGRFQPDQTLALSLGDFGRPRPEARAAGTQRDDQEEQQGVEAPPTKRRRKRRQGAHTTRRYERQHSEGLSTTPDGGRSIAAPAAAGEAAAAQKSNRRVYLTMNERPSRAFSRSSPRNERVSDEVSRWSL